jgi:hypothetical protein
VYLYVQLLWTQKLRLNTVRKIKDISLRPDLIPPSAPLLPPSFTYVNGHHSPCVVGVIALTPQVHVQDVAAAMWHVALKGTPGAIYNLADYADTSKFLFLISGPDLSSLLLVIHCVHTASFVCGICVLQSSARICYRHDLGVVWY